MKWLTERKRGRTREEIRRKLKGDEEKEDEKEEKVKIIPKSGERRK